MDDVDTYVEIDDVKKMIDETYDFLVSKNQLSALEFRHEIMSRLNEMKLTLEDIYNFDKKIPYLN